MGGGICLQLEKSRVGGANPAIDMQPEPCDLFRGIADLPTDFDRWVAERGRL